MIKNFSLIFVNENQCVLENKYFHIIPIIAFLIGFIVFKFIFGENKSQEDKQVKIKQAKEFLRRHQKEDEDFFFGDR
jgi:hypothetical protein